MDPDAVNAASAQLVTWCMAVTVLVWPTPLITLGMITHVVPPETVAVRARRRAMVVPLEMVAVSARQRAIQDPPEMVAR